MKNLKNIYFLFLTLTFLVSCDDKEYEFGDIVTPSNIAISSEIVGQDTDNPYGDGSGTVHFTASATNAITYKYIYGGKETMAPSGNLTINFSTTGVTIYNVTVVAYGTAGVSSASTTQVEVLANYSPPEDLLEMLYGDGEKTWRIKAESGAHFGVGPADGNEPIWWAANAYDKAGLGAYDDRIVFKSDGTLTYQANGGIYGKSGPLDADFGVSWETNSDGEYENYPIEDFTDTWTLSAPDGQETLTFNGKGFHGFYVGGDHSYTILERSANEMTLKTIGADGLAWFCILTSKEAVGETSAFNTLVWSDEFDTNGTPNSENWTYDIGAGGWGNGESQTYTNDAENVYVDNGILYIKAKADGSGGYTSARLKSQGLQSFKYGRIEVSAKLPTAQGTWPAIWMLGDSYATVGWPTCGEIDIMEQKGTDKDNVLGTFHWLDASSSSNASYGETTTISNATSEFHTYSLEWTETALKIYVDGVKYTEMANSSDLPFNDKFFMILNVAMGGTLGGTIDADFTEDVMEVDYVRVYQ